MKKLLASLIGLSLLLATTGCVLGPRDEKQAFIDATVEATCHIFQAKNIFDPAVETEAKEIYKKYGFNADDKTAMETIANKYAADEEVKSTIMTKIQECSKGVPGLEGLQNPTEATTPTEEATGDETTTPATETPAETTPATETTPAAETPTPATETPAATTTPATEAPAETPAQ